MRKFLVSGFVMVVILVADTLLWGTASFAASGVGGLSTLNVAKYGIELTLPKRWDLVEVDKAANKKGKLKLVLDAPDALGEKNVSLYARKAKKREPLKDWVKKNIPKVLDLYSAGHGYSLNEIHKKEVVLESGIPVFIEYHVITINGIIREVAFVYFSHSNRYFYFVVFNSKTFAHIKKSTFVEEILIPNLKLF